MDIFSPLLFFVLGAFVASFVGVYVARLSTGESIVWGRSRCDACDELLPAASLVPLLSFCAFLGRASCCGARLSFFSPVAEGVLGTLFMLGYLQIGLQWALVPFLFSVAVLLALVLYDLEHHILPPALLVLFVLFSIASSALLYPLSAVWGTYGGIALIIAFVLFALHFFSRGRAMGLSDAPLAFGLSLLVGDAAFTGFLFSFWIGAVIGIVVLLKRPYGSRIGVEVPFAPFLAAGFLLAYFTKWNLFFLMPLT